jgi:hypothetical protein
VYRILQTIGLKVPRHRFVRDAAEVTAEAADLTYFTLVALLYLVVILFALFMLTKSPIIGMLGPTRPPVKVATRILSFAFMVLAPL